MSACFIVLYVFEKIYKYGLYIMHDLSLILGCIRSVICFYEVDVVGNIYIYCLILRLTLGIGNFMSSHFLSAGHVPLGLGRDNFFHIFSIERINLNRVQR